MTIQSLELTVWVVALMLLALLAVVAKADGSLAAMWIFVMAAVLAMGQVWRSFLDLRNP